MMWFSQEISKKGNVYVNCSLFCGGVSKERFLCLMDLLARVLSGHILNFNAVFLSFFSDAQLHFLLRRGQHFRGNDRRSDCCSSASLEIFLISKICRKKYQCYWSLEQG